MLQLLEEPAGVLDEITFKEDHAIGTFKLMRSHYHNLNNWYKIIWQYWKPNHKLKKSVYNEKCTIFFKDDLKKLNIKI